MVQKLPEWEREILKNGQHFTTKLNETSGHVDDALKFEKKMLAPHSKGSTFV